MAVQSVTEIERVPKLLRDFATSVAAPGPNEDKLVNAAVRSCKDLLQASQCSVWLVDPSGRHLVLRSATGYSHLDSDKIREVAPYPLYTSDGAYSGLTAWIYIHQHPVSADSYSELKKKPGYRGAFDKELHGLNRREERTDSEHPCQQFYGGPISLGDERYGVLKVENKMVADDGGNLRFSDTDKAALDTVAAILAMALKYARTKELEQNQLNQYHAFTVHSIRNELMPIDNAAHRLRKLRHRNKTTTSSTDELGTVLSFLQRGAEGVNFYLNHLLKFLRAEIEPQKLEPVGVHKLVEDEVWLLGEVAVDRLKTKLNVLNDRDKSAQVRADPEFLAAAIKELLRNARKAIFRRQEREEREGQLRTPGQVIIDLQSHSADQTMQVPYLSVTASDNGDAAVDEKARERLNAAWLRCEAAKQAQSDQKGLEFLHWVIERHLGHFTMQHLPNLTAFCMRLPLVA